MSTQTTFLFVTATSRTVDIALVQNAGASNPGNPITGLAYNTASFTAYQRSGPTTTSTAVSLANQTVGGVWASGGFVEIDATHQPGSYRFDVPNALLNTVGETNIVFSGATNLATHTLKIIVTGIDFYSSITGQLDYVTMTEGYAAPGARATVPQCLNLIQQMLQQFAWSGSTLTVKKLDGTTTAATFTANDPVNASSLVRTS